MDYKELWEAVLGEIKLNISKANYLTWFKDTFIIDAKEDSVLLAVPSSFAKEWLENKYHKEILRALYNLNPKIKTIKYQVNSDRNSLEKIKIKKRKNSLSFSPSQEFSQELDEQLNFSEFNIDPETNLNPKYSFENFVVGTNNELAHAAALAVTENLGKKYNPLFIYGGVGLGKTHLLQAIGNEFKKEKKKIKIKYVPSERFTDDLVNAIRNQKMDDFKKGFRNLDLLLIDDVQFIAGKDKTQEELFHTFNTLYERNKQIVFTSDRPPKAIPSIEERLRSRFEGGMIADIGYPNFETRLAILKSKNQGIENLINEEILHYIAEVIPKNIRELEGAYNRIVAHARLKNSPLSLEEVKKALSVVLKKSNQYIPAKDVIKKVAVFYDLDESDILGHSRKKELVKPRQIAMYLLREELRYSYTNIAEKLGNRDHTTVIYACKKISEEIEKNPVFSQEVILLREILYNQ
ncbi:MAG: chromosomal replication initiator protein DnaA [Candidatus Paceibacterota bacterium]|jgi:chromosomal replication initiator protein|nr:chromosomal replication initiator protein DnaA [Candidatus Paceibacterota bacterium]